MARRNVSLWKNFVVPARRATRTQACPGERAFGVPATSFRINGALHECENWRLATARHDRRRGFSGASVAVQLVRASSAPLAITVIEPRPNIGGGLAYSTDDFDHRLNAPIEGHLVDPADHTAFRRWCMERRIAERDPDAVAPDGSLFARRSDFGAFVNEIALAHARWPTGSTIHHMRDMATDASVGAGIVDVQTARGNVLASELLIVATGNALPRLPAEFASNLSASPAVIAVPTDLESVRNIPAYARVLVIGSGLTALDVLSTLIRSGHGGEITVISRRGLRPRSNLPRKAPPDFDLTRALLDRVSGPVAPFIEAAAGNPPTILSLLRALRTRIRTVDSTDDTWHMPFDEFRDIVWQVWPTLPTLEKRRFMRHLRPWWDAHRFRTPPQNETIVRDAERNGHINFRAARLRSVTRSADGRICAMLRDRGRQNERVEHFDAVINCTGIDAAAGARDNPFLAALQRDGVISVDASGLGFSVDQECRPIGADSHTRDSVRIFGPPNVGTFGDSIGAIFIAAQISRALPCLLETLGKMPIVNR